MLQDLVSSLYAAALLCKFYHWNARGSAFHPLHKLLDEVYDVLSDIADELAERQVALGTAVATTPDSVSKAFASPSNGFVSCDASIDAVDDLLTSLFEDMRRKWDGGVDVVTANMLQEKAAQVQKYRWLVASHRLPLTAKKAEDEPWTFDTLQTRVAAILTAARNTGAKDDGLAD